MALIKQRSREERGGVLVFVAVWLTAALAFTVFVIDVGNWFVHRRHLQLQADAAAFAGGDSFSIPCTNPPIESKTYDYGGPEVGHPTSPYNAQIGGAPSNKLHLLINATAFWNKGGVEFTDSGEPCLAKFVDVKLTEAPNNTLSFFAPSILPTINAHARVSFMNETSKAGSLPIAVPNPLPKEAAALFVNEADGSILARESLAETGALGGGLDGWSGSGVSVAIANRSIGVVVATSGVVGPLSGPTFSTGTLTTICGQPLVSCYDATNSPPSNGVDYIRGFDSSGSGAQPNPPLLRDVELFYTGGCADPWFTYATSTCNVGIEAKVDARNSNGTDMNPSAIQITAKGVNGSSGCMKPNVGCTLSFDSGSAQCTSLQGVGRCWRSTAIPIDSTPGTIPIFMSWKETTGSVGGKACTGNNCTGDFENGQVIQRAFRPDDPTVDNPNAGPLKVVTVYSCASVGQCVTSGIQSFAKGTTRTLNVGIGIQGTLQDAKDKLDTNATCGVNSLGEHFTCLKVAVSHSGNTQALDCDPDANPWYNELAFGCVPSYTTSDGTACPSKNTLWTATPQPWMCVATTTGAKKSDVAKGLNLRILKDTKPTVCPSFGALGHNNWEMFKGNANKDFPAGDPRLVGAYLTAYGTFSNTTGTSVTIPITGFATFYITGWTPGQGQGFSNPCEGNGDDPIPGENGGLIVGHFVRYVDSINTGGGTDFCDLSPNAFGNCVPVLTQ